VSKARDDFPEPDTPVKQISAFLGSFRLTFFRLWTRAPLIVMDGLGIEGLVNGEW
jgi:hypothetical protein